MTHPRMVEMWQLGSGAMGQFRNELTLANCSLENKMASASAFRNCPNAQLPNCPITRVARA
jgi:hypothetical protein